MSKPHIVTFITNNTHKNELFIALSFDWMDVGLFKANWKMWLLIGLIVRIPHRKISESDRLMFAIYLDRNVPSLIGMDITLVSFSW